MVLMGKQTTVLAMQSENIIQLKMNSWFCRQEKMETLIRKQQQQQRDCLMENTQITVYGGDT